MDVEDKFCTGACTDPQCNEYKLLLARLEHELHLVLTVHLYRTGPTTLSFCDSSRHRCNVLR